MPDKNVQLPDGRVVAFPDSMADADIAAVIKKQIGPPAPPTLLQRAEKWYTTPTQTNIPGNVPGVEQEPEGITNSPRQTFQRGSKILMAEGAPSIVGGLAAAPAATTLGLGGAYVGGKAGGAAGKYVGGKFGAPTIGEDLGGLTGSFFGGAAGAYLPRGATAVGDFIRDPATGKLTPTARTLAQVGGAGAFGAYGLAHESPYAAITGGAAGYRLGPGIAERIFPESGGQQLQRAGDVMAQEFGPQLGTPENPGPFSPLPNRMPRTVDPVTAAVRQGIAAKIPTRIRPATATEEPEPEVFPVSQSPGPYRGPASVPKSQPSAVVTPEGVPASGFGPGKPRVGNEGRAATWTNERVMQLASQGDREAIAQATLRGMELPPNARYVAGDPNYTAVTYNPRDVTVFSPEGIPIRQGGRVRGVSDPFSPQPEEINPSPFGERRDVTPAGQQRRSVYQMSSMSQPTEGEILGQQIRNARAGAAPNITEGEVMQSLMRDPQKWAKFRTSDAKTQAQMMVVEQRTMAENQPRGNL